jgi:hypothetical protein
VSDKETIVCPHFTSSHSLAEIFETFQLACAVTRISCVEAIVPGFSKAI